MQVSQPVDQNSRTTISPYVDRVARNTTGPSATAMPVEAQMLRDPSQPRIKALDRSQLSEASHRTEQSFLGDLLRIRSLPDARLTKSHQTRKRPARKCP